MMTTQQKLVRALERKGDDLENWNYHDEAATVRGLADDLGKGKFHNSNTVFIPGQRVGDGRDNVFHYIDGEKVLRALIKAIGE